MAALALSAQTYVTNTPIVIDVSSNEIVNPGRGFYLWNNTERAPVPSIDHYVRYMWTELETATNSYNFQLLSNELASAQNDPDGSGTFGFSIMPVRISYDRIYPTYLTNIMQEWYSTNKACWVPDWNNTNFLARIEAMMSALGAKFNNDPRLGFVEIRHYGNWGEWHLGGFETPPAPLVPITTNSIHRIIDAYVNAFPNKQLIMMSDNSEGLAYAMSKTNVAYPIGWRRDSWCNPWFYNLTNYWGKAADRWKTAPVICEAYGGTGMTYTSGPQQAVDLHISAIANANFGSSVWNQLTNSSEPNLAQNQSNLIYSAKTSGYRYVLRSLAYSTNLFYGQAASFTARWSNVGVAPAYRDWQVSYRLRNQISGAVAWAGVSQLDLRSLLPTLNRTNQVDTPTNVVDTFVPPVGLANGIYLLEVLVSDPAGYSKPLKLAIQGVQTNGAYSLGTIVIGSVATNGFIQTAAGPWDYNTASNWVGNNINGVWDPSLALAAAQTVTFAADTMLTTALNFNCAGNFGLTLKASAPGVRTLNLGGDIGLNTGGGTSANVILGDSANHLNVNLGNTARTLNVAANRTLTFLDVISSSGTSGGITLTNAGTVVLSGANTYTGPTAVKSSSTLTVSGAGFIGGGVSSNTLIIGTSGGGSGSAVFNYFSSGTSTVSQLKIGAGGSGSPPGVMIMTNGTINANTLVMCDSKDSTGILNLSGGALNVSGIMSVGMRGNTTTSSLATVNLTNGNLTVAAPLIIGAFSSGAACQGVFNQVGGTVTANSVTMAASSTDTNTHIGTYNLIGGTLSTASITGGTAAGGGVDNSTNNFAGGTLKPTASSTTFLQGLTACNVQNGGAIIDTTSFDITIAQPLLHFPGATTDGLTKLGSGTLTLAGTNTYGGTTTISGGMLALGANGSLSNSALVSIAAGAALNVVAIAPANYTITGSSPQQTLSASSSSGVATVTATGKTFTLATGALAVFRADGSANTVGKISVTGNLTLNANAITVNVLNAVLPVGTNRLLECSGTLANSGIFGSPTITGLGLGAGKNASLKVVTGAAGYVELQVVANAPTTPPNFSANAISLLPGGIVSLSATGAVGAAYSLWVGTNVAATPITNTWTKLTNSTITVSPFTIQDPAATNYPQRFYRFSNP